jgi:hypothetical protein
MRKHVRRRVRIRRPGLDANADINAVISMNVSGSRSARPDERSGSKNDRSTDDSAARPPSESEGGEP